MGDPTTLVAYFLTALAIELTPGPNMAYLALVGVSRGRRAGFMTVVGVALGLALLGALVGIGLGSLILENPLVYEILRWAGAAYVVWLAWDGWREARGQADAGDLPDRPIIYFRRGFATNLLNPKAALFFVTVMPGFIAAGQPLLVQTTLLVALYVAAATLIHAAIHRLQLTGSAAFAPPRSITTFRWWRGGPAGMRSFWRELVELWRVLVLAVFIGGLLLSPQVADAAKMANLAAQGAYAEIHLQQIPPERYAAEITTALDTGDAMLARSLAALAASRDIAIPSELTERIASLPAVDIGATLGAGWNCVVNGDFDSEAGFACVVATDMTGVGDVRDLVGEGGKFIAGQPLDYFTLGIATVGLGLSVATYSSLGSALPVRVGASFVKAVHRVGKLPPRLTAQVVRALERGIDRPALEEAITLATSMRLGELGRPLSRIFNPGSVRLVSNLADDFGTIGKAGGVRAMKLSVEAADSAGDVRRLARVADTYGDRFVGVMKLVGRGALRLGHLLFTIAVWLVSALLWIWSVLAFTLNAIAGTDRFFRRRARKRRTRLMNKPSDTVQARDRRPAMIG